MKNILQILTFIVFILCFGRLYAQDPITIETTNTDSIFTSLEYPFNFFGEVDTAIYEFTGVLIERRNSSGTFLPHSSFNIEDNTDVLKAVGDTWSFTISDSVDCRSLAVDRDVSLPSATYRISPILTLPGVDTIITIISLPFTVDIDGPQPAPYMLPQWSTKVGLADLTTNYITDVTPILEGFFPNGNNMRFIECDAFFDGSPTTCDTTTSTSENLDSIRVTINGTNYEMGSSRLSLNNSTGAWSLDFQDSVLAPGTYSTRTSAFDSLGNESCNISQITISARPKVDVKSYPLPNPIITGSGTPILSKFQIRIPELSHLGTYELDSPELTIEANSSGTFTWELDLSSEILTSAMTDSFDIEVCSFDYRDSMICDNTSNEVIINLLDQDGDGILDYIECDSIFPPGCVVDTDGDLVLDYLDTDSDNDSIPDSVEKAVISTFDPFAPEDHDGDGIPNYRDTDSDNDKVPDAFEGGYFYSNSAYFTYSGNTAGDSIFYDSDRDGIPNFLEKDADADGLTDSLEFFNGPAIINVLIINTDSELGSTYSDEYFNFLDTDSDNDGLLDSTEAKAETGSLLSPNDFDGDGKADYIDIDSDNDNILDSIEVKNSLGVFTGTADDNDSDTKPNYFDLDSDADGIPDSVEFVDDPDSDGVLSFLDLDSDNDLLSDNYEYDAGGVFTLSGSAPNDLDKDGIPDFKDTDSDEDGINDIIEINELGTYTADVPENRDAPADNLPNHLDIDSDNDNINDSIEGRTDPDNDMIPNYLDTDSDGDGIPDSTESVIDQDIDNIPNYLDLNSDGDILPDSLEGTDDPDLDGLKSFLDLDSDGDGLSDTYEYNGGGLITLTDGLPSDFDNNGIPDYKDKDADGDSIYDNEEIAGIVGYTDGSDNPDNRDLLSDSTDTFPNHLDGDSDNDGVSDLVEGTDDVDKDGIPNYLDIDSDNDGIIDEDEGDGDADGDGDPDIVDPDSDNDGLSDGYEFNSGGIFGTTDGEPNDFDNDGKPDYLDTDSDNDGILDMEEIAGIVGYTNLSDTPDNRDALADSIDNIPNHLDSDSDNDGLSDKVEGTGDFDKDGTPDYLDFDSDGDGISDKEEGDGDEDGDGIPDTKDLDADGDGIPDLIEGTDDVDKDGKPNYLDLDSDADGLPDSIEFNTSNTDKSSGIPDDNDRDGIFDFLDKDTEVGLDNNRDNTAKDDGILDGEDEDYDNDGIPNKNEYGADGVAIDTDGDGFYDFVDVDSDNDDIPDEIEFGNNEDGKCADLNSNSICDHLEDDNLLRTKSVPMGLTPNNDGINDILEFPDLYGIPEGGKLEVYDRWGREVYSNSNYKNTWDGKDQMSNSELPTGTYYYVLTFKSQSNNNQEIKISNYIYLRR